MHSKIEPTIPSVRSGLLRSAALVALVAGTTVALGGSGGPASATNLRPSTRTATLTAASAAPIVAIGAENEYANVIGQIGGPLRRGVLDPEQPEHRPAHLRVEPERGRRGERGRADRPERRRLRHVHEQDRIGLAELVAQGDHRPEPARPARRHPEPAPLVQADDHAGRRRRGGCRPGVRSSPPTPPTSRPTPRPSIASLDPWLAAIAAFKAKYHGRDVATTEPVADYLLQAMGIDNLTPFGFQADIMNGVDPSPQDITLEDGSSSPTRVKVFVLQPAGRRLAHRPRSGSPP